MSTWALIVFVVVVTGATLWATVGGGASRRARPASRRASLEVGPPIDTIRLRPGRRTPVPGEGDARRGAP